MNKLLKFSLLIVMIGIFSSSSILYSQNGKCNGLAKCKNSNCKFVDANGDGKCDNFVDANYDGKCDNCATSDACNGKRQNKGCMNKCERMNQQKSDFNINQNTPNPVLETTKIKITLKAQNNVKVIVIDQSGKKIKDVYEGNLPAGDNDVEFSCADINPGIYFYAVQVDGKIQSKQLIKIK